MFCHILLALKFHQIVINVRHEINIKKMTKPEKKLPSISKAGSHDIHFARFN